MTCESLVRVHGTINRNLSSSSVLRVQFRMSHVCMGKTDRLEFTLGIGLNNPSLQYLQNYFKQTDYGTNDSPVEYSTHPI